MDNTEKLYSLLAQVLKIDKSLVNDELKYQGIPQWDSLSHLDLIISIEESFNVSFSSDDIIEMRSVAKVKEILKKYNVSF